MTLEELQLAYFEKFGKNPPPAYKNRAEWLESKLDVAEEVEEEAEEKFSPYSVVSDGITWKVLETGKDFWHSTPLFVGTKEDAEAFLKTL